MRDIGRRTNYSPLAMRKAMDRAIQGGGYAVYVMTAEDKRCCKIGFSENPRKRMRQIQTGQDSEITLFFAIRLNEENARWLEAAIHRYLAKTLNHKRGEWYLMEPETAAQIVIRMAIQLELPYSTDFMCGADRNIGDAA